MRLHWSSMSRARFDRSVMWLVRLYGSGVRLFGNMNWSRIVTRWLNCCVPVACSTGGHFAIVSELLLVRDCRLVWLSPPRGLGGCLGLTIIVSHVIFAHRILGYTMTQFAVGRRQRAIVRTPRRPIIRLSRGDARISMLPHNNERTQWNGASVVLRIWSRRNRRFSRAIGTCQDERLSGAHRRFSAAQSSG